MSGARLWSDHLLLRGPLALRAATRHSGPVSRRFFTSTQQSFPRSRLQYGFSRGQISASSRFEQPSLLRHLRARRLKSDKTTPSQHPDPTPHLGSPEPSLSLSQRLRKLSREYGWAAFGVYMALTALDFPFCFLAVRMIGTDTIGHYEQVVVGALKSVLEVPFPDLFKKKENEALADGTAREGDLNIADDIEEAEAANHEEGASIWTQLGLAYAIHKSFIFIRVPITAAITPKVVKTLRGWGWNIGKRKPKSPKP